MISNNYFTKKLKSKQTLLDLTTLLIYKLEHTRSVILKCVLRVFYFIKKY